MVEAASAMEMSAAKIPTATFCHSPGMVIISLSKKRTTK
jgi:hypothetical protein